MSTAQAEFDTTVRLAIQRTFIDGRPTPTVVSIASDVSAASASVAASFERLAAGHVIVLVPGRRDIMMSAPFAGRPTDFAVTVGGRSYHANCVWDALGVSAMFAGAGLDADALVRTTCGDCGAPLAIEIHEGVARAEPDGAVAHFAVPAARWWADIAFT